MRPRRGGIRQGLLGRVTSVTVLIVLRDVWTRTGLRLMVERFYLPALRWGLERPWMFVVSGVSLLVVTVMTIQAGVTPFVIFPKVDSPLIGAKVVFPR